MSTTDLDVVKVMGELKAGIRKARSAVPHPTDNRISPDEEHRSAISTADTSPNQTIAAEIASLHQGYDIVRPPFHSHRKIIGRAIIIGKNLARELLLQIFARQVNYNGANARVVTHLQREIESLRSELEQMKAQTERYRALINISDTSSTTDGRWRRDGNSLNLSFEYFQFEQKHRGSEGDIAARQRPYIPWFEGRSDVLDIGCGRGEFLELLRQAHISHRGVDLNSEMVNHCQRKGLEVTRADAIQFLADLSDHSLGGVFCAQMIEHVEPSLVIALVHLCYRKLRPGGVIIIESPNPGCVTTFTETFYKDLTHLRPYHPASIKQCFESAGFEDIEIKFSSPIDPSARIATLNGLSGFEVEKFNRSIERLNDLI